VTSAFAAPLHGAQRADSATVKLSSYRAGARPVTMTVELRTELQCGRLAGRTVEIALPAQARVPAVVPTSSGLVGSSHPSRVAVSAKTLTIGLALPAGHASCDVITPGVARIVLGRGANVGNPARPGTYHLLVRRGTQTAAAALLIR